MEIVSLKSNARKTFTKQEGPYWNPLEPFFMLSVLADFFINTMFFIYIPATYGILAILFFKHKVKLIKPSR